MDELLQKLKKNFSEAEFQELKAAYDFSAAAHEGQKRQTGEPYFIHPCAVVNILVDLGFDDVSTLVAAFLHDVLEDTPVTSDELEQKFGKEVLELVEGVTKLDKIKFVSAEDEQAENLRKGGRAAGGVKLPEPIQKFRRQLAFAVGHRAVPQGSGDLRQLRREAALRGAGVDAHANHHIFRHAGF